MADRRTPSRFHVWFDAELARRGWGDREAGRRLDINHVTVGSIRNGSTKHPSLEVLTKIAAGLDADVAMLQRWLVEPSSPEVLLPPERAGITLREIADLGDPRLELAFYRALAAARDPALEPKHKEELLASITEGLRMIGRHGDDEDGAASR